MPLAAVPPPHPPIHLLLPLTSSLLYVVAALSLKRASDLGVGTWRTTFISNLVVALVFAPLPLFEAAGPGPFPLWQPALIALLYVAGQALTMYSLNRGDVSIATPVIGTKVVFVAFFATLIMNDRLGVDLWTSAAMSACGIALLNRGREAGHRHVGRTILAALIAAACYAMFDILVRSWADAWGKTWLLPAVMWMGVAMSLVFVPAFEGPLFGLNRPAAWALGRGSLFIGVQSLLLTLALARWEDTTRINVIYNARGLWSVLAVWLVGHWFVNRERGHGAAVFAWRLAGAVLMLGAILVAVLQPIGTLAGW